MKTQNSTPLITALAIFSELSPNHAYVPKLGWFWRKTPDDAWSFDTEDLRLRRRLIMHLAENNVKHMQPGQIMKELAPLLRAEEQDVGQPLHGTSWREFMEEKNDDLSRADKIIDAGLKQAAVYDMEIVKIGFWIASDSGQSFTSFYRYLKKDGPGTESNTHKNMF